MNTHEFYAEVTPERAPAIVAPRSPGVRVLSMVITVVGAVLFAALSGCGPDDECDPDDDAPRCDGNTAVYCGVEFSDNHKPENPYVWNSVDCSKLQLQCFVTSNEASCK